MCVCVFEQSKSSIRTFSPSNATQPLHFSPRAKKFLFRVREFMRVLSNEYPSGLIVEIEQKNDVSNQSFRSKQFNPSTTPMILRRMRS